MQVRSFTLAVVVAELATQTAKVTQRSANTSARLCDVWEETPDQEAAAKGPLGSSFKVNKP